MSKKTPWSKPTEDNSPGTPGGPLSGTLGSRGSYPPHRRQASRIEDVVLFHQTDITDVFISSVTRELNGFSSHDIDPVDEEDVKALFYYAVLCKTVYVTNTPMGSIRTSDNKAVQVRRLDDRWVLPGAFVPVLGAIGNLTDARPVQYYPKLTQNIVDDGAKALTSVQKGRTRLSRIEDTLRQMERVGLLVVTSVPAVKDGQADVMTAITWERELYFHRDGIEGVVAAIASILGNEPESWSDASDETKGMIMSTFVGREAFGSVYLPEDVALCVREYAREFTRERQ